MGLFDHLFKSKSPADDEKSALKEKGKTPPSENVVRSGTEESASAQAPAPKAFLQPKGAPPRGADGAFHASRQGVGATAAGAAQARLMPAPRLASQIRPSTRASTKLTGSNQIVLTLGDVLSRIPTRLLRPGLHDSQRELRFKIDDLSSDIARGRAAIALSRIAALCPDIFLTEIRPADDLEIRLPLQKLVEQIGLLRASGKISLEGAAPVAAITPLVENRPAADLPPVIIERAAPAPAQARAIPPPARPVAEETEAANDKTQRLFLPEQRAAWQRAAAQKSPSGSIPRRPAPRAEALEEEPLREVAKFAQTSSAADSCAEEAAQTERILPRPVPLPIGQATPTPAPAEPRGLPTRPPTFSPPSLVRAISPHPAPETQKASPLPPLEGGKIPLRSATSVPRAPVVPQIFSTSTPSEEISGFPPKPAATQSLSHLVKNTPPRVASASPIPRPAQHETVRINLPGTAGEPASIAPSTPPIPVALDPESLPELERVHLALVPILRTCPRELIVEELPPIHDGITIAVPLGLIERQLSGGQIEISALRFVAALPPELRPYFHARSGVNVLLPIEEVFQSLPAPPSEDFEGHSSAFAPIWPREENPALATEAKLSVVPSESGQKPAEIAARSDDHLAEPALPQEVLAPASAPAPAPASSLALEDENEDFLLPEQAPTALETPTLEEHSVDLKVVGDLAHDEFSDQFSDAPPRVDVQISPEETALETLAKDIVFVEDPRPVPVPAATYRFDESAASPSEKPPHFVAETPLESTASWSPEETVAEGSVSPVTPESPEPAVEIVAEIVPSQEEQAMPADAPASAPKVEAPHFSAPKLENLPHEDPANSSNARVSGFPIFTPPPPQISSKSPVLEPVAPTPPSLIPPRPLTFKPAGSAPEERAEAEEISALGKPAALDETSHASPEPVSDERLLEAKHSSDSVPEMLEEQKSALPESPAIPQPTFREAPRFSPAWILSGPLVVPPPPEKSVETSITETPFEVLPSVHFSGENEKAGNQDLSAEAEDLIEPPTQVEAFLPSPSEHEQPLLPAESGEITPQDSEEQLAAEMPRLFPNENLALPVAEVSASEVTHFTPLTEEPMLPAVSAASALLAETPILHLPLLPRGDLAVGSAEVALPRLPFSPFDQNTLQALFMTDELMDLSGVAKHAAKLPGIQACVIVVGGERADAGHFPAAFDLSELESVIAATAGAAGQAASHLGMSRLQNLTLYGDTFSTSVFSRPGASLCVVHRTGAMIPGVRERLTQAADELGKVSAER